MGIPTGVFALLMPMDQLVDPARTAANVNSTLVNSLMVDK
jgi:Na+/H+-dicarboxylate symporter